jgi:hypothetical protein
MADETVKPPTETAAPPAPGAASSASEIPAPAELRKILGLPETATDQDVINALAGVVANLQAKLETVLDETVKAEEAVVNRELDRFKDRIPEADLPFWTEALVRNRAAAVGILENMFKPAPASGADRAPGSGLVPPAPGATPLLNRAMAVPPAVMVGASDPKIAKIRNRANELAAKGAPWREAFESAERELA